MRETARPKKCMRETSSIAINLGMFMCMRETFLMAINDVFKPLTTFLIAIISEH
jgi:hypothetical protein